jgi:hypothetical protein
LLKYEYPDELQVKGGHYRRINSFGWEGAEEKFGDLIPEKFN